MVQIPAMNAPLLAHKFVIQSLVGEDALQDTDSQGRCGGDLSEVQTDQV